MSKDESVGSGLFFRYQETPSKRGGPPHFHTPKELYIESGWWGLSKKRAEDREMGKKILYKKCAGKVSRRPGVTKREWPPAGGMVGQRGIFNGKGAR